MNKKVLSVIIYAIGIACVIFFGVSAIVGGNTVNNPDAMIPFTKFESNVIILGIGFIPMIASCLYLLSAHGIKDRMKRVFVLVPGIITGIPFVIGVCFVAYMLILGLLEIMGIR